MLKAKVLECMFISSDFEQYEEYSIVFSGTYNECLSYLQLAHESRALEISLGE